MKRFIFLGALVAVSAVGMDLGETTEPTDVRCVCHVHSLERDYVYTTQTVAECHAMSTGPADPFWQTCRAE